MCKVLAIWWIQINPTEVAQPIDHYKTEDNEGATGHVETVQQWDISM